MRGLFTIRPMFACAGMLIAASAAPALAQAQYGYGYQQAVESPSDALERNVRTATVIGIVGAGGIGQELKGRFEMFDFGHVATLLLVIFVAVVALEHLAGRLRARLL